MESNRIISRKQSFLGTVGSPIGKLAQLNDSQTINIVADDSFKQKIMNLQKIRKQLKK